MIFNIIFIIIIINQSIIIIIYQFYLKPVTERIYIPPFTKLFYILAFNLCHIVTGTNKSRECILSYIRVSESESFGLGFVESRRFYSKAEQLLIIVESESVNFTFSILKYY